jgi:hypothetical protein
MNGIPTNCMECEHGWCSLVLIVPFGSALERGLTCHKLMSVVWQGKTYPACITPPADCPLRKEQKS